MADKSPWTVTIGRQVSVGLLLKKYVEQFHDDFIAKYVNGLSAFALNPMLPPVWLK
jgi:hypothetical protein